MITSTSRYAYSTLAALTYEDKDIAVVVPSQQTTYTFTFLWHQITAMDRVDLLAYQYYSDPTLWWKIADANPSIMNWHDLTPGQIIRIPTQ